MWGWLFKFLPLARADILSGSGNYPEYRPRRAPDGWQGNGHARSAPRVEEDVGAPPGFGGAATSTAATPQVIALSIRSHDRTWFDLEDESVSRLSMVLAAANKQ